jgi:hypothetical protein
MLFSAVLASKLELDDEARAARTCGFVADGAAVGGDQLADDEQAEASARRAADRRRIGTGEAVEQVSDEPVRYARAVVAYRDDDVAFRSRAVQLDRWVAVFGGIADQVDQHLAEVSQINQCREVRRSVNPHARRSAQGSQRLVDRFGEIDRGADSGDGLGVDAEHQQQIGDELREPVRGLAELAEVAATSGVVARRPLAARWRSAAG